jgi:flagellar hook assembly protein FlgD
LNPADGVEFLTQLTQFSQLEQTMAMREELEVIRETMTQPADKAGE